MADVVVGDLDMGAAVGWIGLGDDDSMAVTVIGHQAEMDEGRECDPMIISVGVVDRG